MIEEVEAAEQNLEIDALVSEALEGIEQIRL